MERIWNYIHYYVYLFEVNTSKIIGYPIKLIFDLIYKIPFISNGLKRKNSSREEIKKASEEAITSPIYGQNITIAGIQMSGLLVILEYCFFNLLQATLGKSLIQYVWGYNKIYTGIFILVMLLIPYIINNQLLWKNDKYLKYFKEFDKESKQIRNQWAWISVGIIIGIFGFFILSFMIAIKVLGNG